jgi:hypothetical protein
MRVFETANFTLVKMISQLGQRHEFSCHANV